MMKKLLALLLCLLMALSLAACGSDDTSADETADTAVTDTAEETDAVDAEETDTTEAEETEAVEGRINEEQKAALIEAYNEVAPIYNEVATLATDNGWLDDEQTAAELQAVGGTLSFVGSGLTEDISMLDGSDFEALPGAIREFGPALEEVRERVSVPYEG